MQKTFPRLTILLFLVLLDAGAARPAHAQGFQEFVARLNSLPLDQRQALVDSFLSATSAWPVIDGDSLASFVFTGTPGSVTVPGDANGWDARAFPMIRVQGTTLWYHTRPFEPDARLDYKYVLDGSTWILDPRNPLQVSGGYGPNSELRMPTYVPAPEIQYYPGIPHGSLRDTTWSSVNLGNSRTIRIYTPPGYDVSAESFPVVFVHDGLEYVTLGSANNVFDYLISEKRIEPLIGVFIPPVNRTAEYAGGSMTSFSRFMVDEIVPYIDRRYRTTKGPASRAVLGASNGGNISLWLGYHYPGIFGNVAAYSSNIVDSLRKGFSTSARKDLTLYLDLGTYDISVLIPLVRGFIPVLQSKGYAYEYREYHEGHSWGSWRAHLDNSLELFFGRSTSVGDPQGELTVPGSLTLHQNYPNPFNPTTVVRYELPAASQVRLAVYDLLGREVALLVNRREAPGVHEVKFVAAALAGGVYLYRLVAGDLVRMRKMIVVR